MGNMKLNTIKIGETAYVLNISNNCNSKLRFMDLGFTSEAEVTPVWQGSKRTITAYLIKGTLIALRSEDAGHINVFF